MKPEELMNFDLPVNRNSIIKVFGVGGGGSNAVNHMFIQGIKDVDFVICNTDSQALAKSPVQSRIQIGATLTDGRGAGNKPEQGRQAAIENIDDITEVLKSNTKMVFITAGMGGGTGTGAAPVIAKAARDLGILTVGIVTIPFKFEGPRRINQAIDGICELKELVDSLLVINNERLREMYGNLTIPDAFAQADNVLTIAAKGIAEIITVPGHVNVDFEDVKTVMSNSGVAVMGSAAAEGENRAIEAIQAALTSPLLNNNDILGAKNILLNIISGTADATMDEVSQIMEYAQEAAGRNADMIYGLNKDESLGNKISVTIIATGFDTSSIPELMIKKDTRRIINANETQKQVYELGDQKMQSTQKIQETAAPLKTAMDDKKITEERIREYYSGTDKKEKNGNTLFSEQEMGQQELENNQKRNIDRLKKLNDIQSPENVDELYNEPAYRRSNMEIKETPKSDASDLSRYSLFGNGEVKLKPNSYLHDNVD